MYKPDDKDIDRLSRDAAEHYHAPGQPAWDALQQILDKELPQDKEKKRRGFFFFLWLLLGLSVAGSGIWYGTRVNHENKAIAVKSGIKENNGTPLAAQQQAEATNSNPESNATAAANSNSPENKSSKNKTVPLAAAPAIAALKNTTTGIKNAAGPAGKPSSAINKTASKNSSPVPEAAPVDNNNSIAANNDKIHNIRLTTARPLYNKDKTVAGKKIKNNTALQTGSAISDNNKPVGNTTAKQHDIEPASAAVLPNHNTNTHKQQAGKKYSGNTTAGETATEIAAADIAIKDPVANKSNDGGMVADKQPTGENNKQLTNAPGEPVSKKPATAVTGKKDSTVAAVSKPAAKKTASKKDRALNIGLVAGLDLSTVRFTHGDDAGYNFGIMGGYQFNKHWSVYTGIIYTKKNYDLNGSDYHPPKHYWTQYVDLERVEGYCRMWEVPLLARYTFNPGAKTAFFASAGLSSYFMKQQDYNYSFKNMGVSGTSSWTNDSTFNHVFSILHLSAGFEKQLGKHMNWQIEPYAKIPLGGVGFGNIRLSSFGINLSVQYRHPIKR